MAISAILFKSKDCPLCRQMEPVFKSIEEDFQGKISSETVDVLENTKASIDNGVMSIPTIIIFKDGVETARFTGATNREKIKLALEKNGI